MAAAATHVAMVARLVYRATNEAALAASSPAGASWLPAFVGWLCLLALAAATRISMQPPALPRGPLSETEFSAARASAHVARIAREPHPTGSVAAQQVEHYIAEHLAGLGLRVVHQDATACTALAGLRQCARVSNVIGTLPGRDPSSSLLLSAHYDSLANAPGAADDAAGVAALMETARALARSPRLEHDVVFAFVDGEEEALLGSAAFVEQNAAFRKVRIAANFEARGSSGASALVGASSDSAELIEQFGAATPHPVLSSFYCVVAGLLPNGTDAEVYLRSGLKTLSFAFIDGVAHYHQGTDSPQNLDAASLQHHGEHALSFARHFANADLDQLSRSSKRRVFFDLFGAFVVSYPYWLARALALLGLGLLAILWRDCRQSDPLISGKILRSALAFVASLAVIALLLAGLGAAISVGWQAWAAGAHRGALFAYLAAVGGALLALALAEQKRRWGVDALVLGPLLLWALLGLAIAGLAPGATPVLAWPLLGAGLSQLARRRSPLLRLLLLAPVAMGATQLCFTLLVVLGGAAVFVPVAYLLFALGLAAAELESLAARLRASARVLLPALALAGLVLGIVGRVTASPPSGSSIAYGLDSNSGRAFWLSSDARVGRFGAQFLGAAPSHERGAVFAALTPLLQAPAPPLELPGPSLELISQATTATGRREVVLRVQSPRGARAILVWEATHASVDDFQYQSRSALPLVRFSEALDTKLFRLVTGMEYSNGWTVWLVNVPSAGGILRLETRETRALELRALDKSEGLPFLPAHATPRGATETVGPPGDQVWVTAHPLLVPELATDAAR